MGHTWWGICLLFFVISWNFACCSNNTAEVYILDINWAASFDTFDIYFAHTKTDQTGSDAKYPCHLFANRSNLLVCPVFALGLHFSCNFNTPVDISSLLFPGTDQHTWCGKLLIKCLKKHVLENEALGYCVEDLGMHSIWKGAVSYLASLVCGPPTCIWAGWTMVKVRDVYMQYMASGVGAVSLFFLYIQLIWCVTFLLFVPMGRIGNITGSIRYYQDSTTNRRGNRMCQNRSKIPVALFWFTDQSSSQGLAFSKSRPAWCMETMVD